ncbi:MAG: hypothetical protein RLZZ214_1631, partial [Verrucomicrobiota bacterium]
MYQTPAMLGFIGFFLLTGLTLAM